MCLGPSGSHGGRAAVPTTVGQRNGSIGDHGSGQWAKAYGAKAHWGQGPWGQDPWALAQSPFTDHAENYFSENDLFLKKNKYFIL